MKKKRRKKRYGIFAFFLVLFFWGGVAFYVYGQVDTTTTATNVVNVGKVDVELGMEEHDAGQIAAGDMISNIVEVENVGNYPAYVRVFVKKYWKIKENGQELTQEQIATKYPALSVNAIDIQLEYGWTKGDGSSSYPGYECYYYNMNLAGSMGRGMPIRFSGSYTLKTEQTTGDGGITNDLLTAFTKNAATVDGYYEVIVEAIQADTCIPETSTVDGEVMITNWNDVPNDNVPNTEIVPNPNADPDGVVNFKSENTEITNASAFLTMKDLVPGKAEGKKVKIQNTSDRTLPIYVYAESSEAYDSLDETEKEWLQQLQLVIEKEDGKVLYQNSLYKPNSEEAMLSKYNPVLIGNFDPNTSQNLYVYIYCPASWEQGDVEVKVDWIFASQKSVPTKAPSGGGGGAVIITTKPPVVTEEPVIETEIPKITEAPATAVPKDTEPVVTDVPKETDRVKETEPPIVTEAPTAPVETGVVITDSPVYEGKETIVPVTKAPTIETPVQDIPTVTEYNPVATAKPTAKRTAKPVAKVTKEPTQKPKVTESPVPDYYLDGNNPADNVPRRTSTPKEDTTVKDVYPTKTGDATPIVVWLALFVVSCMGMCVTFTTYQRRR